MKWMLAAALTLLSPAAGAQAVPDEVLQLIKGIEEDAFVTRYGATIMGDLQYDQEYDVIDMSVDPSAYSYIHVQGDENTLSLKVSARIGAQEVASNESDAAFVTLHIPPGTGSPLQVQIEVTCADFACSYFAQAFQR